MIYRKRFIGTRNGTMVLLFFVLPVFGPAQTVATGSKMSVADARKMLDHHNEARHRVGVAPLHWDRRLAAYAQRWAEYLAQSNHCKLMHRSGKDREGSRYGENIFWGSSKDVYTPLSASESWYSEKDLYNHERLGFDNHTLVGHYTQMVWRNTRSMGAGMAVCPSGGIVVVANYDPPGNYIGEFPY